PLAHRCTYSSAKADERLGGRVSWRKYLLVPRLAAAGLRPWRPVATRGRPAGQLRPSAAVLHRAAPGLRPLPAAGLDAARQRPGGHHRRPDRRDRRRLDDPRLPRRPPKVTAMMPAAPGSPT